MRPVPIVLASWHFLVCVRMFGLSTFLLFCWYKGFPCPHHPAPFLHQPRPQLPHLIVSSSPSFAVPNLKLSSPVWPALTDLTSFCYVKFCYIKSGGSLILRDGPAVMKDETLLLTPAAKQLLTCRVHPLLLKLFPVTGMTEETPLGHGALTFRAMESLVLCFRSPRLHHWCSCGQAAGESSPRARQALVASPECTSPRLRQRANLP